MPLSPPPPCLGPPTDPVYATDVALSARLLRARLLAPSGASAGAIDVVAGAGPMLIGTVDEFEATDTSSCDDWCSDTSQLHVGTTMRLGVRYLSTGRLRSEAGLTGRLWPESVGGGTAVLGQSWNFGLSLGLAMGKVRSTKP